MTFVEWTETNNVVDVTENKVIVEVGPSSILQTQGGIDRRERVIGSSFSGSDGDTNRDYTYTFTITGKEIVSVGNRVLDPSTDYSLSSNAITNDTITITDELFDDETVILWQ